MTKQPNHEALRAAAEHLQKTARDAHFPALMGEVATWLHALANEFSTTKTKKKGPNRCNT